MTTRADFSKETGALEVASTFKEQIRGKNGELNRLRNSKVPTSRVHEVVDRCWRG